MERESLPFSVSVWRTWFGHPFPWEDLSFTLVSLENEWRVGIMPFPQVSFILGSVTQRRSLSRNKGWSAGNVTRNVGEHNKHSDASALGIFRPKVQQYSRIGTKVLLAWCTEQQLDD